MEDERLMLMKEGKRHWAERAIEDERSQPRKERRVAMTMLGEEQQPSSDGGVEE